MNNHTTQTPPTIIIVDEGIKEENRGTRSGAPSPEPQPDPKPAK